jgi:hypothetical protein
MNDLVPAWENGPSKIADREKNYCQRHDAAQTDIAV